MLFKSLILISTTRPGVTAWMSLVIPNVAHCQALYFHHGSLCNRICLANAEYLPYHHNWHQWNLMQLLKTKHVLKWFHKLGSLSEASPKAQTIMAKLWFLNCDCIHKKDIPIRLFSYPCTFSPLLPLVHQRSSKAWKSADPTCLARWKDGHSNARACTALISARCM